MVSFKNISSLSRRVSKSKQFRNTVTRNTKQSGAIRCVIITSCKLHKLFIFYISCFNVTNTFSSLLSRSSFPSWEWWQIWLGCENDWYHLLQHKGVLHLWCGQKVWKYVFRRNQQLCNSSLHNSGDVDLKNCRQTQLNEHHGKCSFFFICQEFVIILIVDVKLDCVFRGTRLPNFC